MKVVQGYCLRLVVCIYSPPATNTQKAHDAVAEAYTLSDAAVDTVKPAIAKVSSMNGGNIRMVEGNILNGGALPPEILI